MAKKISETENEVYRFIKILFAVVIVILGVYLFTNSYLKKEDKKAKENEQVEISSNRIIAGSIFNRPYDEYYVIAYKSNDNSSTIYDTIVSMYASKDKALKIYVVDLDSALNKDYYSNKGNKSATSLEDLKLSNPTLIKINKKKIIKYIEGQSEIKKELGV